MQNNLHDFTPATHIQMHKQQMHIGPEWNRFECEDVSNDLQRDTATITITAFPTGARHQNLERRNR